MSLSGGGYLLILTEPSNNRGDVVEHFHRRRRVADMPVDDVCNVVCSFCGIVDIFGRLRRRQVGVDESLTPWQAYKVMDEYTGFSTTPGTIFC